MEGDIEEVEGKPLVTRIRVKYNLKVPKGRRADAERAVEIHERGCPAAMSVKRGIVIEYSANISEE